MDVRLCRRKTKHGAPIPRLYDHLQLKGIIRPACDLSIVQRFFYPSARSEGIPRRALKRYVDKNICGIYYKYIFLEVIIMGMDTAKIFTNGKSQAVRLPKEYRFDTDEVYITKEKGVVSLFPKPKLTWEEFFATTEKFPDVEIERPDNIPPQQRELF